MTFTYQSVKKSPQALRKCHWCHLHKIPLTVASTTAAHSPAHRWPTWIWKDLLMVQIYKNFMVISPCCLQHVWALTREGHSVDPDLHGPHGNTLSRSREMFSESFSTEFKASLMLCDRSCSNTLYTASAYHHAISTPSDHYRKPWNSHHATMFWKLWYSVSGSSWRDSLQMGYAILCIKETPIQMSMAIFPNYCNTVTHGHPWMVISCIW